MLLLLTAAFATTPTAMTLTPGSAADLDFHGSLMAELDHAGSRSCRTGLVMSLRQHWEHMDPRDRQTATEALAPFRSDLFAEKLEKYPQGAPPPAKGGCWSQEMDNVLDGEHFHIEYEDGVDEDDVQQFLEDLELSWEVEVNDLGWNEPDGSDDYLMSIYVENRNTYGAYTTVSRCGSGTAPYIVSGKDSWADMDWGATMASHEFNHALQFSYGYAPEFWWWEATATWIENLVYPSIHQWSWYVTGYTQNPWLALNASGNSDDEFNHMYGMAVWGFLLEDNYGGPDTIRQTWENAKNERTEYGYGAKDMVRDLGLDMDEVYLSFIIKNTVMEYNEHQWMPDIDLKETITSLPENGKSSGGDVPQGYGQNYIKFKGGSGKGTLTVEFEGDDSVDWNAALVEAEHGDITKVDSVLTTNGKATLSLDDIEDIDVYLVVSPLTQKEGEYDYEWSAEMTEESTGKDTGSDEDSGTPDDSDNDDNDDDSDDDGDDNSDNTLDDVPDPNGVGCGCQSGSPTQAVGAAVALAALAAGRRKLRNPRI